MQSTFAAWTVRPLSHCATSTGLTSSRWAGWPAIPSSLLHDSSCPASVLCFSVLCQCPPPSLSPPLSHTHLRLALASNNETKNTTAIQAMHCEAVSTFATRAVRPVLHRTPSSASSSSGGRDKPSRADNPAGPGVQRICSRLHRTTKEMIRRQEGQG